MTKFFIAYNPYTKEYDFRRNGIGLNENNRIVKKFQGMRLQTLLGSVGNNWEGIAKEIHKVCNDSDIEVVFYGRKMDFDDLEYCLKDNNVANFTLKLQEASNDSDIIRELDTLFREIKESGIEEFEYKNENGESIFDAYNRVKEDIFNINVIATMSSGKSTLINSLLHTELLPAKNEACTERIARILDNDAMAGRGYKAVCYGKDGGIVREEKIVKLQDLKDYNESKDVACIDIEGDIPAVSGDKIRLRLCDTPGPNNSRNEHHEEITNGIIREKNAMVLYVMNAQNFAVDDDKNLLETISMEMKKSGKESRDRFIFVLNKCDVLDEGKGETVENAIESVRDYLEEKFNIIDPVIVPTSAQAALLIWKARNRDELTRNEQYMLPFKDDLIKYDELHYEKHATLTPSSCQKLEDMIETYHRSEETKDLEAVIHSGIGALEVLIEEYIEKYAYPIKISDAIQDIIRISRDIDMTASFHKQIESDECKRTEVLKQIEKARRSRGDSLEIVDKYKRELCWLQINKLRKSEDQYEIDKKLENITREYAGKREVDETDADRMIGRFVNDLKEIEKECRNELNHYFEKEVYRAGEEMLTEYKKQIESVLDDIKISGYKFKRNITISEIQINDLDDIKSKNKSDRWRIETRWMDNPEREGFWGFFKFWEPWKISYPEKVKDGVNVDVESFVANVMGTYRFKMDENIAKMYAEAKKLLEEYKTHFENNIKKTVERTNKILDQLERDTKDCDRLRNIIEAEKEKVEFVKKIMHDIETIIQF